jgi:thiol-disulfide isomerase/thioredoxin
MQTIRVLAGVSLALAVAMASSAASVAQVTTQPATTTAPATAPAEIPMSLFKQMDSLAVPATQPTSQEEYNQMMEKAMTDIIAFGKQLEQDYPDAPNLYLVRVRMLRAAGLLAQQTQKEEYQDLVVETAQKIIDSPAPAEYHVVADHLITRMQLGEGPEATEESDAQKIRAFVDRHKDGGAAAQAKLYGLTLAMQTENEELEDELAKDLETNHADDPMVMGYLRSMGRIQDEGRPFEAELTLIDGSKLTLPDDLLGKVVVVDFWATWCAPCVQAMPKMKELYEKYNSQGVEFVGISVDHDRKAVEEFIKTHELPWRQAADGPQSPTATRYGIRAIPSVWVVGKDGKVISSNAAGSLEEVLRSALGLAETAPATAEAASPATAPATTPAE